MKEDRKEGKEGRKTGRKEGKKEVEEWRQSRESGDGAIKIILLII